MNDSIPRETFQRLAAAAGYPRVADSVQLIEAGADAWSSWTELSTSADRARVATALIPGFTSELLATEAAERRVAAWFKAERPLSSVEDLVAMGLGQRLDVIVSALHQMPPCVLHHVVTCCWLIGITADCRGWCWQAPPQRADLQIIVLDGTTTSGAELYSTTGHELAHAWLMPTAPADRALTIRERQENAEMVARLAAEWQLPNPRVRDAELDERQAAALAKSWGFEGPGADADFCATGARLAAMPSKW